MKKFIKLISVALLTVFTALCFTACVPSTAEKAAEKFQDIKYNYDKTYVNPDDFERNELLLGYGLHGIQETATKFRAWYEDEEITVFYFANTADADRFYKEYVEYKYNNNPELWEKISKQGKMVCYGSINAYKAFSK